MKGYKALGLVELSPKFFQHFWDVFKVDLTRATRDFFITSNMLGRLNKTFIVLVPKIQGPKRILGFKPISLFNMIY